jgi:2-methylisocitrate lyase-like PEP mutase family enzyme
MQLSQAELVAMGVKRISVGSASSRVALGVSIRGVHEMRDSGRFAFADQAIGYRDLEIIFSERALNS